MAVDYTSMFGFTNNIVRYQTVVRYRDSAIYDGWVIKPTYPMESAQRASTLSKNDFKMLIVTRRHTRPPSQFLYEASVSIFGPDGLAIRTLMLDYDMHDIIAGLRRCNYCGATDVETQRVGGGGRSCTGCITEDRVRSGLIRQ